MLEGRVVKEFLDEEERGGRSSHLTYKE